MKKSIGSGRGSVYNILLKSLQSGDKYGYEICKEIEEKTNGTYILKQPSLYSGLKRLEAQNLITSYWRDSDLGGRRHYYSLTDAGLQKIESSNFSWEDTRDDIVNSLFEKSDLEKQIDDVANDVEQIKQQNQQTDMLETDIEQVLNMTEHLTSQDNQNKIFAEDEQTIEQANKVDNVDDAVEFDVENAEYDDVIEEDVEDDEMEGIAQINQQELDSDDEDVTTQQSSGASIQSLDTDADDLFSMFNFSASQSDDNIENQNAEYQDAESLEEDNFENENVDVESIEKSVEESFEDDEINVQNEERKFEDEQTQSLFDFSQPKQDLTDKNADEDIEDADQDVEPSFADNMDNADFGDYAQTQATDFVEEEIAEDDETEDFDDLFEQVIEELESERAKEEDDLHASNQTLDTQTAEQAEPDNAKDTQLDLFSFASTGNQTQNSLQDDNFADDNLGENAAENETAGADTIEVEIEDKIAEANENFDGQALQENSANNSQYEDIIKNFTTISTSQNVQDNQNNATQTTLSKSSIDYVAQYQQNKANNTSFADNITKQQAEQSNFFDDYMSFEQADDIKDEELNLQFETEDAETENQTIDFGLYSASTQSSNNQNIAYNQYVAQQNSNQQSVEQYQEPAIEQTNQTPTVEQENQNQNIEQTTEDSTIDYKNIFGSLVAEEKLQQQEHIEPQQTQIAQSEFESQSTQKPYVDELPRVVNKNNINRTFEVDQNMLDEMNDTYVPQSDFERLDSYVKEQQFGNQQSYQGSQSYQDYDGYQNNQGYQSAFVEETQTTEKTNNKNVAFDKKYNHISRDFEVPEYQIRYYKKPVENKNATSKFISINKLNLASSLILCMLIAMFTTITLFATQSIVGANAAQNAFFAISYAIAVLMIGFNFVKFVMNKNKKVLELNKNQTTLNCFFAVAVVVLTFALNALYGMNFQNILDYSASFVLPLCYAAILILSPAIKKILLKFKAFYKK